MKLVLENGDEYEQLNAATISDALGRLDGVENGFAILLETEEVFMQTALNDRSLYALEYRDAQGQLYETATLATLEQVTSAFQKYAQRDHSWLRDFRWQPLRVE